MPSILVVDDDHDLLELVCQMIAFSGHDVKGISDAQQVHSCLQAQPFDVVLMDIYIGNYDGREIARTLKSQPCFRDLPVILYSAGIISEESVRLSGADAFLKKPFDMSDLLGTIEGLLPSSRAKGTLRPPGLAFIISYCIGRKRSLELSCAM